MNEQPINSVPPTTPVRSIEEIMAAIKDIEVVETPEQIAAREVIKQLTDQDVKVTQAEAIEVLKETNTPSPVAVEVVLPEPEPMPAPPPVAPTPTPVAEVAPTIEAPAVQPSEQDSGSMNMTPLSPKELPEHQPGRKPKGTNRDPDFDDLSVIDQKVVDYTATAGLTIGVDGEVTQMNTSDFAASLGYKAKQSIFDRRRAIPNFDDIVRARRKILYSNTVVAPVWAAITKRALGGDAKQAEMILINHDAEYKRTETKVETNINTEGVEIKFTGVKQSEVDGWS